MWTRCNYSALQSLCFSTCYRLAPVHPRIPLLHRNKNCQSNTFCSSCNNPNFPSRVSKTKSRVFNCSVRLNLSTASTASRPFISFESGTLLNKYLSGLVDKYNRAVQDIAATLDSAHLSNGDSESSHSSKARIEDLNKILSRIEPIATLFTQHRQHLEEIEQLNEILQGEFCGKDCKNFYCLGFTTFSVSIVTMVNLTI